jgi:hypothetical protein
VGVQRIPSGGGSRPVNGGPVCSGPPPGQRSFVAGESLSPHLYVGMPEPASRAVPLLEHARALEGDYAAAHGLLALCHEILFVRAGFKQDTALPPFAMPELRSATTVMTRWRCRLGRSSSGWWSTIARRP